MREGKGHDGGTEGMGGMESKSGVMRGVRA
jgi:hypothetical protein